MSKIEAIAALGMQAHKLSIETIANNIANMNTSGFKSGRVNFPSMMFHEAGPADQAAPALGGTGLINSVFTDFTAGKLSESSSEFDVAIEGAGFFEVAMPDGSIAYTRGGKLQVNADSMLASSTGAPLKPGIRLPATIAELRIAPDGKVYARGADQKQAEEVGQLEMVNFANPAALRSLDNGVFAVTDASGEAIHGMPGAEGFGIVAQKRIEGSNVNMVEEMVNLMAMQRGYEALAKVVQANEALTEITNNLRK